MAATIIINRLTGAGPTLNEISSGGDGKTRASTSDNHYTTETTNPIPIPTAGTKYSYWVVTRLQCTVAPSGTVNNLKWYTDAGGFGTGVNVTVDTATSYVQATGTPGDTGTELTTTSYSTIAGTGGGGQPASDAFAYTSGSPLSVTGSTSGTGEFGDRVVYQFEVISTASAGDLADETFTWQYDET